MARPKKDGKRATGIQGKKGFLYIVTSRPVIKDGIKKIEKKWIATKLTDNPENVKRAVEIRKKLLDVDLPQDKNSTMAGYVDYVLKKKKREVSDTTYSAYFYRSKRIKDYFGDLNIKDVNSVRVERFLDDLFSTHHIQPKDGSMSYTYELPENVRDKILILCFRVDDVIPQSNKSWERGDDIRIKINGVKNTLSNSQWKYHNGNNLFEYVISDFSDTLTIEFTGKDLFLSELTAYTLEPQFISNLSKDINAFDADISRTKGDFIHGSLTAESDGYVNSSFVFHEGFTIWIDGNKVEPIKTDTTFLGFPINEGTHDIKIHFSAPLLKTGKILSLIGCMLFILSLIVDIKKRISCKKEQILS